VTPATWPRPEPTAERLLRIDPRAGTLRDHRIGELPSLLRGRDLLVVNDAGTLPASLNGRRPSGEEIEVRLAAREADGSWRAVLFGSGDWRERTEDRAPPPRLAPGDPIRFGEDLNAVVVDVARESPRLVRLRFGGKKDALWPALYRRGRPVQYSYLSGPLALWHVQTAYAARPWAVEMPSAGRPLTWELLLSLRERGVGLAALTHAAGLSSTGDPGLDALLPLPEGFEIPAATVTAVRAARAAGGRVVAVGTTVVRALEAAADGGELRPGPGRAELRIDGRRPLSVVNGVLTGVHEPGTGHFELLRALAPEALLLEAHAHSEAAGYLTHEFGDSWLILGD
jgi:S-adenosylmethionine:tRNA ribosyltransferase-isomerase